jgi:Tfp pilus assembly protein PilF
MRAIRCSCRALLALVAASSFAQETTGRGIAHFHRGEYAVAARTLEAAPESPHRNVFLALSRAALGRCAEAEVELSRHAREKSDVGRLAGLGLAQCFVAANRMDDATAMVSRLMAAHPADADVLYLAARVHMRTWNGIVQKMFESTPASFRVNQLSAEIFETQGRYADAIAEYRKAIAKNAAALNLHFRLGRALLLNSHGPQSLAAARKEFEAELVLNPGDAAAEYQVGQILLAEQKSDAALARFERALEGRPDFPEAMLAIAKLRLARKENARAIALLESAVRLQPRNEAAHYNLMLAYRNAGRTEDAAREAEIVEKLKRPPEGEFTDFLKRIGAGGPKQ